MDFIYFNGNLKTQDSCIAAAGAVAVKGGVIVRVGNDEEILALATPNTQKIDLQGKFVLPGFSDSHMHLVYYANSKLKIDLFNTTSIDSLLDLCKDALEKNSMYGNWLLGCGWNQDYWDVPTFPTRHDLDKISTEVPIAISRACYHVTVVNSKALAILKITKNTPQLKDGAFDIDEFGEPNGILRENAQGLVMDSISAPDMEEIKTRIVNACNDALAQGITSIHSDDFEALAGDTSDLIMRAYTELAEADKLPLRIYQQCLFRTPQALQAFLDKGHRTGEEHGFYKMGPLKLLTDGSLGARTAYLREAYNDDPNTRGIALFNQSELDAMVDLAHANGMQVAIHCIGNAAMDMAIDSIEKAMIRTPRVDPRHGIVHCQITDLPLLERFRSLNIIAYIQPIFIRYDNHIVDCRVGSDLACTSYNWRSLIDMGVHTAGGSDCPVEKFDVLPNIYCAVTRKDFSGWPEFGWYPENRITVDEAVKLFTVENAYAAFQENERGSISIGKFADMVVLNEDIYHVIPDHIKDVSVAMTIVNGEIKYKK